jgi:hypothetical protein
VRLVRFAAGVALVCIGAFSCAEEAEPWRGTVDSFFDAVEAGDPDGASALCAGDPAGLAPYLEPGARPEIVGEPVSDGGRVELTVRTPGKPGLVLVLVENDGDSWLVDIADSRETTLASALNAAFGGE